MDLPDLPRKNNRIEAKIDARVAQWFVDNHDRSVLLEVKMTGGRLAQHQKRIIDMVAKTGTFFHKFRDGGLRTCLDYVILHNADAVLAVCDEKGYCHCTINNRREIDIKV